MVFWGMVYYCYVHINIINRDMMGYVQPYKSYKEFLMMAGCACVPSPLDMMIFEAEAEADHVLMRHNLYPWQKQITKEFAGFGLVWIISIPCIVPELSDHDTI